MPEAAEADGVVFGKGTNGVSANGVAANFMFCCLLPLTYFYLPKSARAYLFPQHLKVHDFCSGPSSVDPICPQPRCGDDCIALYLAVATPSNSIQHVLFVGGPQNDWTPGGVHLVLLGCR